MKKIFNSTAIFLLFVSACTKKSSSDILPEEMAVHPSSGKSKASGCAVITAAYVRTFEQNGANWIEYNIAWNNPGGKKTIEVIPDGAASFVIDATQKSGVYSRILSTQNLYGTFIFRTITRTGKLNSNSTICEEREWEIVIEQPAKYHSTDRETATGKEVH